MAGSQRFNDYRKSLGDLKKAMKAEAVTRVGKFGVGMSRSGKAKLIWSVPSDNVVMAINTNSGIIRMRPTSRYYDAISDILSVVPSDTLLEYRTDLRDLRTAWYTDYYITKNMDKLRENGDKPGLVVLDLGPGVRYADRLSIYRKILNHVDNANMPNTSYSMIDVFERYTIGEQRFITMNIQEATVEKCPNMETVDDSSVFVPAFTDYNEYTTTIDF